MTANRYTRINFLTQDMLYQKYAAPVFAGPLHVDDFVMLFCATPDCQNFCESEESVLPGAAFKCRTCNKSDRHRIGIQIHQFDKDLGGHAPEGTKTPGTYGTRTSKRNAKSELRGFLDGNDPIMDGHQVLKDRAVDRECPEWIADRFEFLNFLCEQFPKWLGETSPKHRQHREQAALYAGVMYFYFRLGLPDTYVAELLTVQRFRLLADGSEEFVVERKVSKAKVKRIVLAIRRRHDGLRADGTKLTGKCGRPRVQKQNLTKATEMLAIEGVI